MLNAGFNIIRTRVDTVAVVTVTVVISPNGVEIVTRFDLLSEQEQEQDLRTFAQIFDGHDRPIGVYDDLF